MSEDTERESPVALIVGGSGGIGAAIVERFVAAAWTVIGSSTRARTDSDDVRWVTMDTRDSRSVTNACELVIREYGRLDAVVFAVGAPIDQPYVSKATSSQWTEAHSVETSGAFFVTQAVLPTLRDSGGSLCFVTSSANKRYSPGDVLSAAPKAAIEALSRAVSVEEGKYGVRANCVAVGVVEAGMFLRLSQSELSDEWLAAAKRNIPLRRFGAAEDVANAAHFLCSAEAKYISGQVLAVDGGYSA